MPWGLVVEMLGRARVSQLPLYTTTIVSLLVKARGVVFVREMWSGRSVRRFLLLLLLGLWLPVWAVEVSAGGSSHIRRPLPARGVDVVVGYVHSVERTWVEETYVASHDGLRLHTMRWQSFSAGLPDEYDYYADGFYVSEFDVQVGPALDYWFLPSNHVEVAVDGEVVLQGPEEPSRIVVRVRRMPLAVAAFDQLSRRHN